MVPITIARRRRRRGARSSAVPEQASGTSLVSTGSPRAGKAKEEVWSGNRLCARQPGSSAGRRYRRNP